MESVAILYNTPLPETADLAASSRDVLDQVAAVRAALETGGFSPFPLAFDRRLAPTIAALGRRDIGAVFNLCETVEEDPSLAGHPAAVLELMNIAFTGSPAQALMVTTDKHLTQRSLRGAGIVTPGGVLYNPARAIDLRGLRFPVIVKPVLEDASIGIEQESVFADEQRLREQLPLFYERYGNLLVEEFIVGREFNLAVFGFPQPRLLPPAQIDFSGFPKKLYPIVGYRAKWDPDSIEYRRTPRIFPDLPAAFVKKLEVAALACFRLFALRDYARIDVRVDDQGNIFVIDVNANPCLSPDAGFAAAAARAGIGYQALVTQIVAFARLRRSAGRQRTLPLQKRLSANTPADLEWGQGLQSEDVDRIRALVAATGFFSGEETAIAAELAGETLVKGDKASGYFFVTVRRAGQLVGYTCYGPIPGTADSFDIYWIVVAPALQAKGLGRRLMERTEAHIQALGGRRIFVDTSQRPQYEPTRRFYQGCGYRLEAVLADFYAPGEAKAIYGKRLC